MVQSYGVDSEIGALRAVLMHRPRLELMRITPRTRSRLHFDVLPWVGRAQEEHDVLAGTLRDHGVDVLYLTELLQDVLEYQHTRDEAIAVALRDRTLGDELRDRVRDHLVALGPEHLAEVLIAGLTPAELKVGRGVVFEMLERHEFVLDPVPNLLFTRDTSFWVGDGIAVASMMEPDRRRESGLLELIYRHHPRFAGIKHVYWPGLEHLDGGDVLLLGPGVVAVGVGERTTPAAAERFARQVFSVGLAHTVLAVPLSGAERRRLDTYCTVVDFDTVVMHPAAEFTLRAHTITHAGDGLRVSRAQTFPEAAASALGIERLRVIDTGFEPAFRRQWEDGNNALAIGRRRVICHERNVETRRRLEEVGIEVIPVPGNELVSRRGGPRCMTCALSRDRTSERDDASRLAPSKSRPRSAQGVADEAPVSDQASESAPRQAVAPHPELVPEPRAPQPVPAR